MAADLHIHVLTDDVSEDDLRSFFSSTLGSKYFSPLSIGGTTWEQKYGEGSAHQRVSDTPNVWIGEVSWLKQALIGDTEGEYVPDLVQSIATLVGEDLPVIDDEFIDGVQQAYNKATSHHYYNTADRDKVIQFLNEHRGQKVFQVSW